MARRGARTKMTWLCRKQINVVHRAMRMLRSQQEVLRRTEGSGTGVHLAKGRFRVRTVRSVSPSAVPRAHGRSALMGSHLLSGTAAIGGSRSVVR